MGEDEDGSWRPVIILAPGVTAEWEDPLGVSGAFDDQSPSRIQRAHGRSGGGVARGRR
jgi:hypothetical protein